MKVNFAVDVAFEIKGDWENFDAVPYKDFIAGLEKRLATLKAEPDREAFGLVDAANERED